MIDHPLFSVLIANYNNGKYLREAIASVYAQTYTNWEIILVDDASTDNSKELYKNLEKDSRVHIYYNEENKGCGYTKRRCADLATGMICGFLDPDDTLLPKALELMAEIHCRFEDVSIVYSRCYFLDFQGNKIGENAFLKLKEGETYFDYRWYGAMHFVSYKKKYYDRTEGISAIIKAGVDQDLYFKVEEKGKVYVLNKFTYNYYRRDNGNQLTSSKNAAQLYYWNLEVRRQTCIRRGLDVNKIISADFASIMKSCTQKMLNEIENNRVQSLLESHSYRLGNFILTPLIVLKRIFNKPVT